MSLVYIVTLNQIEGKKIFEQLALLETDRYRLEFEFLRPTQLPEKLEPGVDLVVYNNPNSLNMSFQQSVARWRKAGFFSSIILLSKVTDQSLIKNMEGLHNFVLLEKPYDEKDLKGIADKMLRTNQQVLQRKFRRFATDQRVEVTSYKTDFKSESRVSTISMGGLGLEGQWDNLYVGDLLKINFSLDKINVERTVNGKVVWVENHFGQNYAGVQFMKEEEVYGQLLRDIG